MAQRDIDPFEIGRRGLAIPFREFPIWFDCAFWPFAIAIGSAVARSQSIEISPLLVQPVGWGAEAIFDWCWMIALSRGTSLHLLTFPIHRSFWLFVVLKLGLSAIGWAFSALLSILFSAALVGEVMFLDVSGPLVQLVALILAPLLLGVGIWAGLRLMIWPAHCAASGRLVGPGTIWRNMQDHSFDALVICVVTTGPFLLAAIGEIILARTTQLIDRLNPEVLTGLATVIGTYSSGAFDAALLIAYYAIFAPRDSQPDIGS